MNRRNQMADGSYKAGRKHGPRHRGEKGSSSSGHWYPAPPDFLPLEERVLPFTVPDELYAWHRRDCRCKVCELPEAILVKEAKLERMRDILRKA